MDVKEKISVEGSDALKNGGMTLSMSDSRKEDKAASAGELVFGSSAPAEKPKPVAPEEVSADEEADVFEEPEEIYEEAAPEKEASEPEEEEYDDEEYEDDYSDSEEYDEDEEGSDEDQDAEYSDEEEYDDEPEDEADEEVEPVIKPAQRKRTQIQKQGLGVRDFSDDDDDEDRPVRRKRTTKKKKKRKKGSKVNNSIFGALIIVTIILTVSLVVAISAVSLGMEYIGVGKNEENITFNIPENATTDEVCDLLIYNDLISNERLFKIIHKLKGSPALYPGDVTLHASMGYAKIIDVLSSPRESYESVKITFKEGITLLDAAQMIEDKKVCKADEFIFEFNKQQDFAFEKSVNMSADAFYKMEGFFFPDTYDFYVNDSAYNVVRTIRANFQKKYEEFSSKISKSGFSLSEVITLASIVQWEANSAEDMPIVASVFINRLHNSDEFPKLQSDATGRYLTNVIDVVGDTATKEHYEELYNTYVCLGLPAGPVCNPGIEAINAVLEPADTNYYYFCNNLKTGESFFAETYEEHRQNLVKAGLEE